MDRTVKNKTMTLIIVRSSIILPNIEIVDWRTEEKRPDIIECLGIRVQHAILSPTRRPLNKRNMQAFVTRIGTWGILAMAWFGFVRHPLFVPAATHVGSDSPR